MARKKLRANGITPGGNSSYEPFARRIIEIEAQRRALAEDIKVVYGEAKDADVLVKPIRLAVKDYFTKESVRVARAEIQEQADAIIHALGGYADTPLGAHAVAQAHQQEQA